MSTSTPCRPPGSTTRCWGGCPTPGTGVPGLAARQRRRAAGCRRGLHPQPRVPGEVRRLNDRQFVSNLYLNTLHRAAEPAGLDHWVAQLQGGASRSDVVLGFSESRSTSP
ncbi:hypothetical protein CTJ15_03360 (plasmid) [Roseomonas sp. FDAARGOS_362]|nr:hypothetical protein CTJ15_03360 [Roseomonas sp. FDAARGOS_362]